MNKHKYRAKPTIVDGIRFASKAEAKRWGELKLLERAGEIYGLTRQERFPIVIDGQEICTYVADFYYRDQKTHDFVVEDLKGFKTPEYNLKKKLMKACYGIEILETGKGASDGDGWITRRNLAKRETACSRRWDDR